MYTLLRCSNFPECCYQHLKFNHGQLEKICHFGHLLQKHRHDTGEHCFVCSHNYKLQNFVQITKFTMERKFLKRLASITSSTSTRREQMANISPGIPVTFEVFFSDYVRETCKYYIKHVEGGSD